MTDRFHAVRAALRGARLQLGPRHKASKAITTQEDRLTPGHDDYDGDVASAYASISSLADDLERSGRVPHGTTATGKKMKQSTKVVLPANVQTAVARLREAVKTLRRLK